jgi:hypothetical protein
LRSGLYWGITDTFVVKFRFLQIWFSPGAPVSSTNKTERHDISEILLKMTLNTLTVTVYISFDIVMLQALAGS